MPSNFFKANFVCMAGRLYAAIIPYFFFYYVIRIDLDSGKFIHAAISLNLLNDRFLYVNVDD